MASSLAADIKAAWDNQQPTPVRASLIKSDNPERLPGADFALTPGEWQQLKAVRDHLRTVAKHDAWDRTPEGSAAAIVAKCTPNVRRAIYHAREFAENVEATGGRTELFQPRQEMPKLEAIDQKLVDRDAFEQIVGGIHERMGTPPADSQADREPDLRDIITASVDAAEAHNPQGEQ